MTCPVEWGSARRARPTSPGPAAEPGIGQQAFNRRKQHADPGSLKDIEYPLEVQDANLRWIAQIHASRITESGWSAKQEGDIQAALLQTAKESYAKVVG